MHAAIQECKKSSIPAMWYIAMRIQIILYAHSVTSRHKQNIVNQDLSVYQDCVQLLAQTFHYSSPGLKTCISCTELGECTLLYLNCQDSISITQHSQL